MIMTGSRLYRPECQAIPFPRASSLQRPLTSQQSIMSLEAPLFPLELERHIFELAAFSHCGMIPTLLRVARRVLVWSVFVAALYVSCKLTNVVED
jgi:hypothetical protein